MRFKHCQIPAFGHLRDFEARKIDRPVVVVQGPNEAGKSTFASFLTTILFGFHPASREAHPYAPRDGSPIEGSARIVTIDGTTIDLRRQLKKTPRGFIRETEEKDLRNNPIPLTGSISRRVFESVYALTLHDMAAIASGAWEEVQERLLGNLSVDYLRPARRVAAELEKEGNNLWRPDRRGKPETRRLRELRTELQAEARKARSRYDRIREIQNEIGHLEDQLSELRSQRALRRKEHERLEGLAPVVRRWTKIQTLKQEAGDVSRFDDVPADPDKALYEWRASEIEIEEKLRSIDIALERGETHRRLVTDSDHQVLKAKTQIAAWSKRSVAYENVSQDLDRAEGEHEQLIALIDDRSLRVFGQQWDNRLSDAIRDLSGAELRRRLRSLLDADSDLKSAEERAATLRAQTDLTAVNVWWIVAVTAGLLAVIIGLFLGVQLIWAIGLAVTLLGAVQLGVWWQQRRKGQSRVASLGIPALKEAKTAANESLQELCVGLPLNLTGDHPPDPEMLADVQEVKSLLEKVDEQEGRVDNLRRVISMNNQAIEELATACGLTVGQDTLETISTLETLLDGAERRVRDAAEAEDAEPSLRMRKEKLLRELEEIREQRRTARELLRELGHGDEAAGIRALENRRVSYGVAEHLETSLTDDFPRWRQIEDEIRKLAPDGMAHFSDEARVSRTEQMEGLAAEIRGFSEDMARLEEESRALQDQRKLDDIESEIAVVDAELERQRRLRDRRYLLAAIIRRADTRFRMKHQPDVVRLAEAHLGQITEGRYERLLLDDETDQLIVFQKGQIEPLVVGRPMSQGTRDQIYLALRFAVADHLDRDQERLPMFLDEVFVNWDTDRRKMGFRILDEMSQHRQIFLFTCHPWLAQELHEALDAAFISFS